jgi:TRAP-type mannitol/chloroaromatic compound transport system substrate-binding protein
MTVLAANLARPYEQGDRNEYPVKASTKIYEGAAVGIEVATGYARGLVAGDTFVGFAEALADNSAVATDGAINVRVIDRGKVYLPVGSLAITDLGKPVYASDNNAFTLTASTNSYIGKVVRFESTGYGIVAFDCSGQYTELTDSSGGSASDTIAAIGASYSQAEVRNAVASLAAKVNYLIRATK